MFDPYVVTGDSSAMSEQLIDVHQAQQLAQHLFVYLEFNLPVASRE